MQLITIIEAAQISGKSIQTIRRMIKHKKIQVKKQKTPQGFNYLIVKESLFDSMANQPIENLDEPKVQSDAAGSREHRPIQEDGATQFRNEVERFTMTIQKLIEQNERDKDNFFQLIKTFQDRVFILENQVKLLSAPKQEWWRFWK